MGIARTLALGLMLVGAAGAVQGQSSVTLYGRISLDVEGVRGRLTDGSDDWRGRVSSNSSRFGLRGSESLGGGHEAIFQLESSVSADAGGGSLAGRDSFFGIRGGWGTLRFGNIKTPYDNVNAVAGNVPTFTSSILDTESVWGNGSSLSSGGFAYRAPNSIRYDLPGIWMKGVQGGFQVSLGENADDAATYTFGGTWATGPWQFGAVYQYQSESRATGLDDWAYSLAVAYDFGAIRVAGVWEQIKYDTPTGSLKRDFWGVSGTFDLGPGQLYAWYGYGDDGEGSAAAGERVGGLARGPDTRAQHYEISYTYPLSKRTSVYAGYVKIDNDRNASYNFATNALSNLAVGGKPEGFLASVNHNF